MRKRGKMLTKGAKALTPVFIPVTEYFDDQDIREYYAYPGINVDNPSYWLSESAYLGEVTQVDASRKPIEKPWYEKLVDVYGVYTAQRTAQKYQNQLAAENAARAKTGQPPIAISDYMQASSPQVNFGISANLQKMLLYGGLGLAAVLLLPKLLKK